MKKPTMKPTPKAKAGAQAPMKPAAGSHMLDRLEKPPGGRALKQLRKAKG